MPPQIWHFSKGEFLKMGDDDQIEKVNRLLRERGVLREEDLPKEQDPPPPEKPKPTSQRKPPQKRKREGHARIGTGGEPILEPAKPEKPKAPAKNGQTPFEPRTLAERLEIWWLNGTPNYFAPMRSGDDWRIMSIQDLRRFLRSEGVRGKHGEGETISETDLLIEYLQNYRAVNFSGPLAGYAAGVHHTPDGSPFIAQGGPKLIDPVEGAWSLIRLILDPRLKDDTGPQMDYLCMWLKNALEPLYEGRRRKGPMLILAGPNNCGKSFIQHHIITPVLGGRSFDPTDFFKKEDGFNKYMMASEHLVMEELPF